jgi:hypothetical protein
MFYQIYYVSKNVGMFPQLLVLWVKSESEGNILIINIVMSFPFQAIILHELLVFKGVDAD